MRDSQRIIIVRHAHCTWHEMHKFVGQSDAPLSEKGVQQAYQKAEIIREMHPDMIIASDLVRAADTGKIIAKACDMPLTLDDQFREEDLGGWTGLTKDEVRCAFSEEYIEWSQGNIYDAGVQREGLKAVSKRAMAGIRSHIKEDKETIVIVTHLNVAISIIASLLKIPMDRWTIIGDVMPCAHTILSRMVSDEWILDQHNIMR